MSRLEEAKNAYDHGKNIGLGIGSENWPEFLDSSIGHPDIDEFVSLCMEHESDVFRQFSPFEFYAKEYNESSDPDFTWESYERGVYRGILQSITY